MKHLSLIFMTIAVCVQPLLAQLPTELRETLESKPFDQLVRDHAEEFVVLKTEGVRADQIEALPYVSAKGFRCQVFASTQLDKAEETANRMRALDLGNVHVVSSTSGLYKVQVGDFEKRVDAEIMLDKLRNGGVSGAWVVETDIELPKSSAEIAAVAEKQKRYTLPTNEMHYTIQVFLTSEIRKANDIKEELEKEVSQPVIIVEDGSRWRVYVGKFPTRLAAEDFKKLLQKRQYKDAWIRQIAP